MTMITGVLGGGCGQVGVEPAAPVLPQVFPLGGGGGGFPLVGTANAGASVEIKSAVTRTRAIVLRQFI